MFFLSDRFFRIPIYISKALITVGPSDKKASFYLSLQRLTFSMLEHTEQKVEKNKLPHKCRHRKKSFKSHIMLLMFSLLWAQMAGTNKTESHAYSL